MPADDLLIPTEQGPFCPSAGAHVDPWSPVPLAIVTHAHSDHAAPGCARYIATPETCALLRSRLGEHIVTDPLPYRERRILDRATLSLHPAGHLLGAAQVRLQANDGGPTWVLSGDYKTDPDPTCAPFEPVPCDVFISETTFGLPIYRWPDQQAVLDDINDWWRRNRAEQRTTLILTYALGKAQRVLAGLDPTIGPIGVHGAILEPTRIYRDFGVALPDVVHANEETASDLKGCALIIATPSSTGSTWPRRFAGAGGIRMAFVSGWMRVRGRRRWQSVDRGFVLSDHVDWPSLLRTVEQTGARRIGLTHGYASQVARYLREMKNLDTFVLPNRYRGELEQNEP